MATLASLLRLHKLAAIERADAAARGVGCDVAIAWATFWRNFGGLHDARKARPFFEHLSRLMEYSIDRRLRAIGHWAARSSGRLMASQLSTRYLSIAAQRRIPSVRVVEHEGPQPFGVSFSPLGIGSAFRPDMPESARRDFFAQVLFPAPTEEEVGSVVHAPTTADGRRWVDRIKTIGTGFTPDDLASRLITGLSQGQSIPQLARDLAPIIDGPRYKATRIARTEGMRVAEAMQRRSDEAVADLIGGYRIRATLDNRTRPEHRDRDRLEWSKDSGVPMEVTLRMDGPVLPDAPNCRCFLEPILRKPEELRVEVSAQQPDDAGGQLDIIGQAEKLARAISS